LGSHESSAQAIASIHHADFYHVPVNGPVFALESLVCDNSGGVSPAFTVGNFSLGSITVSPPVETIFTGASQGSGACSIPYQLPPPPGFTGTFIVSLSAVNNIVLLQTNIGASGSVSGNGAQIFVQLTVDGFQDANGNPIAATLMPEPGTFGTFGLALLVGVGMRGKRKLLTFLS